MQRSLVFKNIYKPFKQIQLLPSLLSNAQYTNVYSVKRHSEYVIHKSGTMRDVKEKIMKRLGLEPGYHPIPRSREHLLKYHPKAEDLPHRSIQDSLTSAIVPLSTDRDAQDKFVTVLGRVRLGRLMEEIDLFAVWICHRHVYLPNLPPDVNLPYTFVTLLVDKVQFTEQRARGTEDIRLTGYVAWTGNTSFEITIWLDQEIDGKRRNITKAYFVMVARNATNTGPAPINSLKAANEQDAEIIARAGERQKKRRSKEAESVLKVLPTKYEQSLLHNVFLRTAPINTLNLNERFLPVECRWMADTYQRSIITTFPENRNSHNSVFGGFLMRCALEITYVTALMYSKESPNLQCISDISFRKPVSLTSLLKLNSYIVYTVQNYMQLMTIVDIQGTHDKSGITTNVFYFTYASTEVVPEVLPRTYHENMWYINGRRIFLNNMQQRQNEYNQLKTKAGKKGIEKSKHKEKAGINKKNEELEEESAKQNDEESSEMTDTNENKLDNVMQSENVVDNKQKDEDAHNKCFEESV